MCFRKKSGKTAKKTVNLFINERLMPKYRSEYYEDTVAPILKKLRLAKIVGGGSQFTQEEGVSDCDIQFECKEKDVDTLVELLRMLPLAKGSVASIYDVSGENVEKEIPLGDLEGIGIFLNGTDLDDEVYKTCDADFVVDEIMKLLGAENVLYSFWQGPRETGLFFYGKSYEEMKSAISDFLASYPLCEKCRVEQIA